MRGRPRGRGMRERVITPEVRAERDELAVAEWLLERVSEQLADERASAAADARAGGRTGRDADPAPRAGRGGDHCPQLALRADQPLAAQAPRLDRALKKVARQGGEVVLIDGTLIPTQRRTGTANRRNHSGKHHHHGLHFLVLTDEKSHLIWISAARPGRMPWDRPGVWVRGRGGPL